MSRLLTSVVLISVLGFFVVALDAGAVSVQLAPGSVRQSTTSGAFFPAPIRVVVRDDAGKALAGVEVEFPRAWESNVAFPDGGLATTDSRGIASVLAVGRSVGVERSATATYQGVSVRLPELTVLPARITRLELVSGDRQTAQRGDLFRKPWVVRAVDERGLGVPNAAVYFTAQPWEDEGPVFATMDGKPWATVMADAKGIATSPRLRAGDVPGHGEGEACVNGKDWSVWCVDPLFEVIDWPAPQSVQLLSGPRDSIEVNTTAAEPFVVKVLNARGSGIAGIPVTFRPLPTWPSLFSLKSPCGLVGGAESETVVTDAAGIAVSSLYLGFVAPVLCPIAVEAGGIPVADSLMLTMFAYHPEDVEINVRPSVNASTGGIFNLDVAMTGGSTVWEGTPPVHPLPLSVQVSTGEGGASATLLRPPSVVGDSDEVTLQFRANTLPGTYQVTLKRGPVSKTVVVTQRAR